MSTSLFTDFTVLAPSADGQWDALVNTSSVPDVTPPAKRAWVHGPNKNRRLADGTMVLPGTSHTTDVRYSAPALASNFVTHQYAFLWYAANGYSWTEVEARGGFRGRGEVKSGYEGLFLWQDGRMYVHARVLSESFLAGISRRKARTITPGSRTDFFMKKVLPNVPQAHTNVRALDAAAVAPVARVGGLMDSLEAALEVAPVAPAAPRKSKKASKNAA
jgi:hypothetical protein